MKGGYTDFLWLQQNGIPRYSVLPALRMAVVQGNGVRINAVERGGSILTGQT